MAVQPLVRAAIEPLIASLPEADLYRYQEEQAGSRPRPHPQERPPYDWRVWARYPRTRPTQSRSS